MKYFFASPITCSERDHVNKSVIPRPAIDSIGTDTSNKRIISTVPNENITPLSRNYNIIPRPTNDISRTITSYY